MSFEDSSDPEYGRVCCVSNKSQCAHGALDRRFVTQVLIRTAVRQVCVCNVGYTDEIEVCEVVIG